MNNKDKQVLMVLLFLVLVAVMIAVMCQYSENKLGIICFGALVFLGVTKLYLNTPNE